MFICVLDFEATCTDKNEFPLDKMEIIEFPSILYKIEGTEVTYISEFHKYVKPTLFPKLTKFCTELTKITQETVDASDTFDIVYKQHLKWLYTHVTHEDTVIFATCGHWDLVTMLPRELVNKGLKINSVYRKYINIKDEFNNFYKPKEKVGSLMNMLKYLNMKFEGTLHNGFDDTKNMSKILVKMINSGHSDFKINHNKSRI